MSRNPLRQPRRTIALGLPYDDGKVPPPPKPESVEDRMDRLERMMDRIEDAVRLLRRIGAP